MGWISAKSCLPGSRVCGSRAASQGTEQALYCWSDLKLDGTECLGTGCKAGGGVWLCGNVVCVENKGSPWREVFVNQSLVGGFD